MLSLSLFNYTDDVMAARDRPNRFFGHYALCRWGFPAAQSSCDRWRPARPFDGVTSRWMKLIRRSDSGERWKQFSALSEIHPKSELDRPWIPLPGDSPEVRIRKIADRAVQVAVVEGIVKVGADCD